MSDSLTLAFLSKRSLSIATSISSMKVFGLFFAILISGFYSIVCCGVWSIFKVVSSNGDSSGAGTSLADGYYFIFVELLRFAGSFCFVLLGSYGRLAFLEKFDF